MTELETLIPQPVRLEIAGETLEITPVVIGEIPKLLKAIQPFAEQLTEEPDWVGLLAEHGEAVLNALAVCSRKPRTWIDTLALDEAIQLFEAVFEANADFFVRRVAPAIARASAVIGHRIGGVPMGQAPAPTPAGQTLSHA